MTTTEVSADGSIQARCDRCRQPFSYVPVRLGDAVIARRTTCEGCVRAEEERLAAAEASLQQRAESAARADREGKRLELLHEITGNAAATRHMTLDTFDPSECGERPLERARLFVREILDAPDPYTPVRGLYFHGAYGPGKTHLAAAVVQELLADLSFDPASIVFDRADELILRIQATYGSRESVFDQVLDRRFNARVWILDDLGTERPSDDAARYLTLILSRRELRPTLITSNLDPEALASRFAEFGRARSRFGPRYFRVLEVQGHDRRFDVSTNGRATVRADG